MLCCGVHVHYKTKTLSLLDAEHTFICACYYFCAVAYDVLSDPEKRRQYDHGGQNHQSFDQKPFDFDAFFGQGSGNNGFFNFNFDDMFGDDMFGDEYYEFGHDFQEFGHGSDAAGFDSMFNDDMFGGFSQSFHYESHSSHSSTYGFFLRTRSVTCSLYSCQYSLTWDVG